MGHEVNPSLCAKMQRVGAYLLPSYRLQNYIPLFIYDVNEFVVY